MGRRSRSEQREVRTGTGHEPTIATPTHHAQLESIVDPALNEYARNLVAGLSASAVAIAIELDGRMTCRARAGTVAPDVGTPVDRDRGITGECVRTGMVVRCEDTQSDPRVDAHVCTQLQIGSILVTPLLHRREVLGVIEAFFSLPGAFDESDIQFLESVAKDIVVRLRGEDEPAETPEEHSGNASGAEVDPTGARLIATSEEAQPVEPEPIEQAVPSTGEADAAESPVPATTIVITTPEGSPRWPRIAIATVALGAVAFAVFLVRHSAMTNAPAQPAAATAVRSDELKDLRKAAVRGDASAQYRLAQSYRTRAGAEDRQQATVWLERAARNGSADAQMEFAKSLEASDSVGAYTWYVISGLSGKPESEEAIRRLTPKLSAGDIGRVRLEVGRELLAGRALARDPIAAYTWLELAEWGGNADARVAMQQLESQLTPSQLRQAKSRTSNWIRRHSSPSARNENPSVKGGR